MFSCLKSRKADKKEKAELSGTDMQQLLYQKNANGYSTAPAGYQLATVAQCQANLDACKAAVNGDGTWAICSLADGKISGSGYGYAIQNGSFLNQGCAVITPAPAPQLIYQKNANGYSTAPAGYQLATVAQCQANLNACKAAVNGDGTWAICSLADGKISGSGYGYAIQNGSFLNQGCAVITPSTSTSSCPNGLPVVASGGQCGAGKGCCPGNECCSQYGWCSGGSTGTASAPWCGTGCQASYGKCGVTSTTCKNVVVTVQTQYWGEECGWSIPGTTLSSAPGAYGNYQTYTATACIPPGNYTFKATDSYGDGWNGATFSISVNGVQVVPPTTFASGSSFDKTFTV